MLFYAKWNEYKEEAEIVLKPEFIESDRIFKLDALQDAIVDLTNIYDEILKGMNAK